MKHTPGPWRSFPFAGQDFGICAEDDKIGADIALVRTTDADAQLIAAAPELLEACQRLLDYAEDIAAERDERPSSIENARAAIAKAA